MEHINQPVLLTITSVVAETVKDTELQVVARWKNSEAKDGKPARIIPEANKQRAVTLPSGIWSDHVTIGVTESVTVQSPIEGQPAVTSIRNIDSSALKSHLLKSVMELAKEYLGTIVEDSNWMRTSVNQSAFSLSSLLAWQEQQAAESARLSKEQITAWLPSSVSVAEVIKTYGPEAGQDLRDIFVKMAGSHNYTPEQCSHYLRSFWNPQDEKHTTGLRVGLKLKAGTVVKELPASRLDKIGALPQLPTEQQPAVTPAA